MRHADEALHDDRLPKIIQEELNKHCKKSKTQDDLRTRAEVVLRMLLLQHMRGWSYTTCLGVPSMVGAPLLHSFRE
jgi:IS5 family transposase